MCLTVAANCNTETQIEMRDRTVEHFPGLEEAVPAARARVTEQLVQGSVAAEDVQSLHRRGGHFHEVGERDALEGIV